jgi:hypothetical protein
MKLSYNIMQCLPRPTKRVSWFLKHHELLLIILQVRLIMDTSTTNPQKIVVLASGLAPIRNADKLRKLKLL